MGEKLVIVSAIVERLGAERERTFRDGVGGGVIVVGGCLAEWRSGVYGIARL